MSEDEKRPANARTRLFSLGTLLVLIGSCGYASQQSYRAVTDSFVAPIILSPDSEAVVASKVKLSELDVEHSRSEVEGDAIDGDIIASEKAIARLTSLSTTASTALDFTSALNAKQLSAGAFEVKTVERQSNVLSEMLRKQTKITHDAKANADAGLITRNDYEKEAQALDQIKLAVLENERSGAQSGLTMQQVDLTQRALSNGRGAPLLPEAILREDQMVRIELELLKLESDVRTKRAERRLVNDKISKMDEIEKELKARPLFKAIDKSIEVAFVPYTQIDGVERGGTVYDCVWGLFACKEVGTIAEVVPGEVILPDPWGNQARGQYAMLNLTDHKAARSKTLRVRAPRGGYAASSEKPPMIVSVR